MNPEAASFAVRATSACIAAVATPMTASGNIDRNVVETYFQGILSRGATGLAAGVHTGRGPELSIKERLVVTEVARSVSDLVVTGVFQQDRPDDREWLEAAATIGVDALLVFPDGWRSPEAALDRFDEIWDRTRTPLIVFDLYTSPLPETVLEALLGHDAVAAFKPARLHDSNAAERGIRQASAAGRCVLTGEDLMLTQSLRWGASGALLGLGAACVEPMVAAVAAGTRSDRLDELQSFIDLLADAVFHEPMDAYVQRMLWIAVDEGLIPQEYGHDPLAHHRALDSERDNVVRAARRARAGVTAIAERGSH